MGTQALPGTELSNAHKWARALVIHESQTHIGFISKVKRMSFMAVRRGPLRRTEREELVAYIHGIDPEGELAHILVHQRGNSVRFSGRLGAHNVSPSNSSDLEKWVQEAKIVWGLGETIGILRSWMNTPESLERIETMREKAMQEKKNLVILRELHAS